MRVRQFLVLSLLLLATGVVAGGVVTTALDAPASSTPPPANPTPDPASVTDGDGNATAPSTAPDYTALYRQTVDSVVLIRAGTSGGTSEGSGFVYATENAAGSVTGYVVTNEHVVGDANEVLVQTSGGRWQEGTVVGTDAYTDLAVVEVTLPPSVEALPVARTDPVPGQRVAALGNPFGLEGSITSGIVSGVNRSMPTERGFTIPATVQTDAPINPGNSGGPLVSMDGTVVGVNRAKAGDNIGFAISPNIVTLVVPELIADGEYDHSFVGIRTLPVTPPVAQANGLENATGALVVGVLRDGPAHGHLRPANESVFVDGREVPTGGDVIVAVEGSPVRTQQDLGRILLLRTHPGETVTMTVVRNGARVTVEFELGERPPP